MRTNLILVALLAVDLQLFVVAPSGELTALIVGKETTFGTAGTVTSTQIADSVDFNGTNDTLERPGATKAVGQNDEPVGMFSGKWNVSVEPDPDNLGAWLLLTMGAEAVAADAGNPTSVGGTTTLSASAAAGATSVTLTATTGFIAGAGFRIDAGLPTQEDCVQVGAPSGSVVTVTSALKFSHASSAAVTPAVLAQDHTFSLSSPRLSFTAQLSRILETINCFGAKVGQLSLSCDPKGIVKCTLSGSYANEATVGSPVSPTYSVINPLIFESTNNTFLINGIAADAAIMSWKVDVATGLVLDYPAYGNGRFPKAFPENKTVVSLSVDIAYETTTQERNFWGNLAATGPQSTVPSLPNTSIVCASPDYINANVPYQLGINFGRVKWTKSPIPAKAKDYLKSTLTGKVYMSTRGANDDVTFRLKNASSSPSL